MDIRILDIEKHKGYRIKVDYETDSWYQPRQKRGCPYVFELEKTVFGKPISKSFTIDLYPEYFPDAIAYGFFEETKLAGIVEVDSESWNNRLRITEIWVSSDFRRKGIGRKMLEFVDTICQQRNHRMIVLETQSSNVAAVAFYLACGYEMIGFDKYCYSDNDPDNHEIRIELGKKIKNKPRNDEAGDE